MCSDTIRRWYDVPHYIFCLNDVINQAKETNNGLEGATDGSIAAVSYTHLDVYKRQS